MRATCPSCHTNYNIDDKRIPPGGAKLRCAKCQTLFSTKSATSVGSEPLPASSSSGARAAGSSVPLPGASAREAATIRDTAIPLPQHAAPQVNSSAAAAPERARSGVSPSVRAMSVPLPSNGAGRVAKFEEGLGAIALPGREQPAPALSVPLPGGAAWEHEKTRDVSQVLPDLAQAGRKPIQLPGLNSVADDLDIAFAEAESVDDPDPPGEEAPSFAPLGAVAAAAAPTQSAFQEPPANAFDFPESSAPSAPTVQDFNFDFAEPADAPAFVPSEPVPAVAQNAPELPDAPPGDDLNFELGEAPSPAAESVAGLPDTFEFASPLDASTGSLDAVQSAHEPPAAPGAEADDFAVDVAELTGSEARAPADDNLEILSFADHSAAGNVVVEKTSSLRYHVRRKSGKIFGPFEQSIIVKMLSDGQLAGTEDISSDRNEWSPIGSVPAFHEMISTLAKPNSPPAVDDGPVTGEVDRLKRLYEGRMAAVNVRRSTSALDVLKARVPVLLGAVAVVSVLAAGASLGFTRYGPFGLRKLFSTRVPRSSAQFAMLQNARKGFLADTYKSYREANELAAAVLKVRDYPEARAVWCESVFYLQRRFNAAKPADIVKANGSLEDIQLLGRKDLDFVKATAGAKLAEAKAPQALAVLQEAAARTENAADLELNLLLAEAYASQGQSRLAQETLTKALNSNKGSARVLHALGNLYQAGNEPQKAAKAYSGALEVDPSHLSSAVELAAIELLSEHSAEKAQQVLELTNGEKGQAILGPTELARARALKGAILDAQGKAPEAVAELEQALKLDPTSPFAKERLAQLMLRRHEFAKALPLYKDVVDKEPQNLSATEGYLSSLIGTAQMDDALKAVAQANARFPGKARIAFLDGRVNDALDKSTEAEKHYKRAINADPKLTDATLYLARLYLRFHRTAEAKAQLEQALNEAPSDARVRAAVGELALLEADVPRARSEFQKAVELDARLAEAHLGLSKVALEDRAFDTARAEAEKALELDVHIKDGRFQHGIVLWRMGQLDDAVAELEKAKSDDPKTIRISIMIGAVMLNKGDYGGAETNLLAALTADPINPEAHFYLAKVKDRRGEYNQAIDSMRNALDRAPKQPEYHYEMGVIYRDARRVNDAIQEWKRAVELDPAQADSLEALGQAYLDRGDFDKAIPSFDQTMRVDSKRTRVLALIGDCYFQAARWDKAIAAYLSALRTDASLKQVFYKLGRSYTEKGQHGQAINWYRQAVEAEPKEPMPYYYLGYAYKEKHHKQEAIEAFKTYLALKTDAEDKKDIEDEIYDLQQERRGSP